MNWDPEAEARVKKAPFFVRPFIRSRAEKAAKERGLQTVTTALLDELKSKEHTGGSS
jgi:Proto-chlorophyllide reductase 57 kD subunit